MVLVLLVWAAAADAAETKTWRFRVVAVSVGFGWDTMDFSLTEQQQQQQAVVVTSMHVDQRLLYVGMHLHVTYPARAVLCLSFFAAHIHPVTPYICSSSRFREEAGYIRLIVQVVDI